MLDKNNFSASDAGDTGHKKTAQTSAADFLARARALAESNNPILALYMYLAAFEQAQEPDAPLQEDALLGMKEAWAIAFRTRRRSLAEYIFEQMEPYLSDEECDICAEALQDLTYDRLEEFGLTREEIEDMANLIGDNICELKAAHPGSMPISMDLPEAIFNQLEDYDFGDALNHDFSLEELGIDPDAADFMGALAEALTDALGIDIEPVDMALDPSGEEATLVARGEISEQDMMDFLSRAKKTHPASESKNKALPSGAKEPAKDIADKTGKGEADKTDTPDTKPARNPVGNLPKLNLMPEIKDGRKSKYNKNGAVNTAEFLSKMLPDLQFGRKKDELLTYRNLAGYDETIADMRDLGIGMGDDADFNKLVEHLNACHGLSSMPSLDSVLFTCKSREDANRFVMATLGELNRPTVYMRLEENTQDLPMLCVSAHAPMNRRIYSMQQVLESGGVLVLEDLDLWTAPDVDTDDPFVSMQMSRGAREMVSLLDFAVAQNDVIVLITALDIDKIDSFFLDLLEPVVIVDIDYPTPEDRVQIWLDIAKNHPSIGQINKADLVRLSNNLSRFDIYMAVREAVDEAYKIGLAERAYKPVTRKNLYDKLACMQPIDSKEYNELVDAVVGDFKQDIDSIEDILKQE